MHSNTQPPYIESLPAEVLARILLLLKRDQDREDLGEGSGSPSEPVAEVFTQVSRCFRNVARGCALLWTTVAVEQATPLGRVQGYCLLSGSAPLSLRIHLDKKWRASPLRVDHVFKLLDTLLGHSHRWQSLSLYLGRECTAERSVVGYLCTSAAPILKYFTLSISEIDAIDTTVAFSTPAMPTVFAQGTDGISTLRLRGLAIHAFRPPLQEITTLHLDGTLPVPISYEAFTDILTTPWHLRRLSVYGDAVYNWPVVYNPLSAISVPKLRSLRIHSNDGAAFQGILLNINAPLLRSLALKSMMEDDLGDAAALSASFPQVEDLAFGDFDLSEVGYAVVVRVFPSIETFRLGHTTLGASKAFKVLSTVLDGHGPLGAVPVPWPRLQTLQIGVDTQDEPSWLLQDLLRNRREMGRPLSKVEVITAQQDFEGRMEVEEWVAEAIIGEELDVDVMWDGGEIRWPFHLDEGHADPDDNLFN